MLIQSESAKIKIAIHATNISGIGATELCKSLFQSLSCISVPNNLKYYLRSKSILISYVINGAQLAVNKRYLFNSISRLFECIYPDSTLKRSDVILVMGDIPLRLQVPQVVYVHQPHLISPSIDKNVSRSIKYTILRALFRLNLKYSSCVVVQTEVMRDMLTRSYPKIKNVIVIGVPPATIYNNVRPKRFEENLKHGLRLFYPAGNYQHKNHELLRKIDAERLKSLNVDRIILTIDRQDAEYLSKSIFTFEGRISPEECINKYMNSDALLFLSKNESYGIPLVEAMFMGVFIVCPNLPYARAICGDNAIYFNPDSEDSLCDALSLLNLRVSRGEMPNWENQLKKIPSSWLVVAEEIVKVLVSATSGGAPANQYCETGKSL